MIGNLFKKIVGTRNSRELKRMGREVAKINALAEDMNTLTDKALQAKTAEFKQRLAAGASLNELLPEAFAVCREASDRTLKMRHFDVQLIGGMTLHEGRIAEMRTGEGKTLVATLAAYLNALSGNSVHLVTVNDYLARRDAGWMKPLYEYLGMTVGVNVPGLSREEKMQAYSCDIIYGTNNEFGFDYLRDNMAPSIEDKMQRDHAFAIVDEVDSILIDEARTPLIISGAAEDHSAVYRQVNTLIPSLRPVLHPDAPRNADILARKVNLRASKDAEPELLDLETALARAAAAGMELVALSEGKEPDCEMVTPGHYVIDEKSRHVEVTELGHQVIEDMLVAEGMLDGTASLYASGNLTLVHHVMTGLRAHVMFHRDVDYIVQQGQVILIDEHTGRKMEGRRLSEGLHQAIEAKEGVNIQSESQTMASTTFQNFFRLYTKLAGMTGTADTEAAEFHQIYGLNVVVIPTNKPVNRDDLNDLIFLSKAEKFEAIVDDIKSCREKGAPALVGTASIESSEELSAILKKRGIKHEVLNAKQHAREADIIAQAGSPGAVTIATNMAGRGTDIVLGGNVDVEIARIHSPTPEQVQALRDNWRIAHDQVIAAGGLHVLGTERHESRRIDNQLRGRSGRQGDPGVSRFYLSLEDDLMRIFASERVKNFMQALGMEKGEAIEHRMVTNAIEKAQRKVEGRNFDMRKQLLEYDDVANDQRQIIYHQRDTLLEEPDISEILTNIRHEVIDDVISEFVTPGSLYEQWDIPALERHLQAEFVLDLPISRWLEEDDRFAEEDLRQRVIAEAETAYAAKSAAVGSDMRRVEKMILLQILDQLWKEHLAAMDHLRSGIHLRSYAQKNPKQEYKRESYQLFEKMLGKFRHEAISFLAKVQIRMEDAEALERRRREEAARQELQMRHDHASGMGGDEKPEEAEVVPSPQQPQIRQGRKVGRNEPCPCGSGQKYKQCHGKLG